MVRSAGLRLVDKAVEVLDLLAEEGTLTIAQISERAGEPRSSLYRLLASLEQFDLVESASTRTSYRLGVHVLKLGAAMMASLDEREHALPVMRRIRDEIGLTAYLVVRRGYEGICVERLEGMRVASLALKLGGSQPLHAGAAPRALLAFEPESFWEEYVASGPLLRLTPSTPTTREGLFEVLKRTRWEGISLSDGDVTTGIAAVGAPVFGDRGRVQAAISVSGLRNDVLGRNAEAIKSLVKTSALEISKSLGFDELHG